jgi:hypothetical protein
MAEIARKGITDLAKVTLQSSKQNKTIFICSEDWSKHNL